MMGQDLQGGKAPLIAAVDVGTNSFHLVIASVNQKGMLKIISRDKEMVRLGSSGKDMKYLLPESIERGVNTLSNFNKIAKSYNAITKAVATSAVREAKNREDFTSRVYEETGIDIEVVSGNEEGRLIYIGAIHALPIYNNKALLIDIGGGSTETIVGKKGEILYVNSEKLGAIRMTTRFFDGAISSREGIKKCREYILGEWSTKLEKIKKTGFDTVVGTSGTIQTLAGMVLTANNKPVPDIINGINVSAEEILKVIKKVITTDTPEDRAKIPGMDSKRADIIVGGAIILEQIIKYLDIKKILISSYALREGIVFDTMQKMKEKQEYKHLSHLRFQSVNNIAAQYNINYEHTEHIKLISLDMFDSLQALHKLGNYERELLEAAAILHDVGYFISHDKHHKHSYYIIMNSIMPGFTNDETEIIANIARYHRKSLPKNKHDNFTPLSREKKNIIRILAGILRIAEGIDRRQRQNVRKIETSLNGKTIGMKLLPANDLRPDIEMWGANRRKDLLEESLDRIIEFEIGEK
ncbi:MAG: HD domain-containing protein [Bacteroidota bacterium]